MVSKAFLCVAAIVCSMVGTVGLKVEEPLRLNFVERGREGDGVENRCSREELAPAHGEEFA